MKIAIDARLIRSSTGRYVEQLIRNLEELDHTNTYKILVYPQEKDYYQPKNPNFEVLTADFKHYRLSEQLGFNSFLRKLDVDFVHFHMPQQPLLYTRPAVTTVHDLILVHYKGKDPDMGLVERYIKRAIFSGLMWVVAHRAKKLITPTEYTKNDLVSFAHIKPDRVAVTLEGITPVGEPKVVPEFEGKKFLVYLGQSGTHKNNRGLIDAHQKLLAAHPDLHLIIIGKVDEIRQSDIDWVGEKGYKNVHFTGWLSDEEATWLYRHAEAFVWPTFREGMGLPPLEAMREGCPVVSTNATCSPEVNGEAAHYFDPYNTDDMARAINDVLTDKSLRAKLIAAGHENIKRFSWRHMAEQTLAVYNDVFTTLQH